MSTFAGLMFRQPAFNVGGYAGIETFIGAFNEIDKIRELSTSFGFSASVPLICLIEGSRPARHYQA